MAPDLVIRDARIIDGTGAAAFDGDIDVTDGRITAVGTAPSAGPGTVELDAAGMVVSPGFVDTHTHDDGALVAHPDLEFKVAQGCTSLVVGNCGFSAVPFQQAEGSAGGLLGGLAGDWSDLDGFRSVVEKHGIGAN